MSGRYQARTPLGRAINDFEEMLIAVFLGLMTIITFANVIARYVFNANILWALEATVFLFGWLVIFGASYCVKISAHLGVDAMINLFSAPMRKVFAFLALACCLIFSLLMLKGSWDYWIKFATQLSFFEVNDVPFPHFLQDLFGMKEDGDYRYDYIPKYIPYTILPIGMALLTLRFLEAGWKLWTGELTMLIASHEAEEMLDEVKKAER